MAGFMYGWIKRAGIGWVCMEYCICGTLILLALFRDCSDTDSVRLIFRNLQDIITGYLCFNLTLTPLKFNHMHADAGICHPDISPTQKKPFHRSTPSQLLRISQNPRIPLLNPSPALPPKQPHRPHPQQGISPLKDIPSIIPHTNRPPILLCQREPNLR